MRELERDLRDDAATDAAHTLAPLAVVGAGRAGRSIAGAADLAGVAFELAGRAHALEACRRAEVALLCVPDAAITDACASSTGCSEPARRVALERRVAVISRFCQSPLKRPVAVL